MTDRAREIFERLINAADAAAEVYNTTMMDSVINDARTVLEALDTNRAADEPTEAMVEAGVKAWHEGPGTLEGDVAAIYRAMRTAQGER